MERRGSICRGRQMVSQPESGARLSTTTTGSGLGEIQHSKKDITIGHAAQRRGTGSQIYRLRRVSWCAYAEAIVVELIVMVTTGMAAESVSVCVS
jgi:hypothetical protein